MELTMFTKEQAFAFWNQRGVFYPYVSDEVVRSVSSFGCEEGLVKSLKTGLEDRTFLGLLYAWIRRHGNEDIVMESIKKHLPMLSAGEKMLLAFILSSIGKEAEIEKDLALVGVRKSTRTKIRTKLWHWINNHIPVFIPYRASLRKVLLRHEIEANQVLLGVAAGEKYARGALFSSLEPFFTPYGIFFPLVRKNDAKKLLTFE